ncbi:MAG TPA: hypothetical protein VIL17_04165 [Coriobacteriia bacterium]
MSDDQANSTTDDALDAELRSLIAERRMDEILANLPCGNTIISAGGISLSFDSPDEDEEPEPLH